MEKQPNVVVIVLDDTGFAHLGCFGSDIATPSIDAIAGNGLRYNRFHVTAMCSPTRASLLTGRNSHAVGVGFLVDIPLDYPGYNCHIPPSAATLPRVLKDAGYSTMAVGKWHLTPRWERSAAGPFDRWPLGYGFERYYGFLQGDTNHWAPNLVADNHYIDLPTTPGYHLTEDLVDTAIRQVLDQQQAAPGKPWFLYLALGATHAPHHVAEEWVAPYAGQFDQGWDVWREETLMRQFELGVVPEGTALTTRPEWMAGWHEVPEEERRMHARQQEVFAGFLTHTDAQIGRLLAHLEDTGQIDDTIIMVLSDNGASAEGGVHGSVNEHRFTNRFAETPERNIAALDDWGGPKTYNHYSWGWALAGNTPLKLWKRYTWLGGVRTPLIVCWPRAISDRGAVRGQFAHANDLMPTLLEACGIEVPAVVDGVEQAPFDGKSLVPTFADEAAGSRSTQYFELLGSRSIWHDGWKATTDHVSQGVLDEDELMLGSRDFATDHWALFWLADDFSEANDVSADHPSVVEELRQLWDFEAERNQVLPLEDGLAQRLSAFVFPKHPPLQPSVFRPGGSAICDESVPMLAGGFRLTADVDLAEDTTGVICALGDWNGGYALYALVGELVFAISLAGDLVRVAGPMPPPGRVHVVITYVPDFEAGGGTYHLAYGAWQLASASTTTPIPLAFQHGGTGLTIGYDRGLPVTEDYTPPFAWTGEIAEVRIEAGAFPIPTTTDVTTALHAD